MVRRNYCVKHLQSISFIRNFPVFVSVLVNIVLADTGVFYQEQNRGTANCEKYFNSSGKHSYQVKEECSVYQTTIALENSSIINLTACIQYVEDNKEQAKTEPASEATINIKVYEFAKDFHDEAEVRVLLEEWNESIYDETSVSIHKNYLSRWSKIVIVTTGTGKRSHFGVNFEFQEVEYRLISISPTPSDSLEDNGHMKCVEYSPNSITLLRLYDSKITWKGITIWFDDLNINMELGEYLLIGTGLEPFKNKSSSLYVSQIQQNSTFYVNNPSAYVAFVSGSVQSPNKNFTIMWRGIEKTVDNKPEDPMEVLNSSLICFYNYSAAIEEFKSDKFEKFRQNFAEIAERFLKEEHRTIIKLDKDSVKLFGNPTKKDVNGFDALALLIKVVHDKKSIFTWSQLQSIIEKFEKADSDLAHKVTKCPQGPDYELPYKDEWHLIIYVMVPVFAVFALMMWAWKHNLFSQNCIPEKGEKVFSQLHAEPNTYAIPRVYRSDEHGRRETLIQGSLLQDERTEVANVVETNEEPDTLTSFLSSQNSKYRPSIQSLLEDGTSNRLPNSQKTGRNESDNEYDSVSSNRPLDETRL